MEWIITDASPPVSSESDARVVRSRSALRAALTALLAEQSFESLTVREITGRAEVGYATFFRHYRDKEALLLEVNELLMTELLDLLLPSLSRRDTGTTALELCRFVEAREAVCRAVLAGGAEGAVRAEAIRRGVVRVEELRGRASASVHEDLGVFHSVSAVLSLLSWWLRTHREVSAADMAAAVDALVLSPTTAWMTSAS